MNEKPLSLPQEHISTKDAKARVLDSLRELPIVTAACKRAGIGKATFYRWQKEDPAFLRDSREALRFGIEFINDMSETQVVTLIKEKKLPAIALWLKHNHPRYGGQTAPRAQLELMPELSAKEARLFKDALALSASVKTSIYGKGNK